jgi:hypothetical protein
MSLANVVAAGVEPHVRVAMLLAVLFAILKHSLQHIRNRAVVSSTIARREHYNISVLRLPCVSCPTARVVWDIPIPFWLCLEVAGLRRVIVYLDRHYCLAGRIVSVVVRWYVAVEFEEDDGYGKEREGKD